MKTIEKTTVETPDSTEPTSGCPIETGTQRVARLTAENAALKAENAALKAAVKAREDAEKLLAAEEAIISEKMAVGLSREQAVAVIRHQKAFDAALLAIK